MSRVNIDLIKDLIISLLIILCLVLIIFVVFYDDVSLTKIIPESEHYKLSAEMDEDLKQSETDESKEIVTTYYIDSADLKKYEKTNEYNKGKQNPFSVESIDTQDSIDTNKNNEESDSNTSSNTSNYYYEDDWTK